MLGLLVGYFESEKVHTEPAVFLFSHSGHDRVRSQSKHRATKRGTSNTRVKQYPDVQESEHHPHDVDQIRENKPSLMPTGISEHIDSPTPDQATLQIIVQMFGVSSLVHPCTDVVLFMQEHTNRRLSPCCYDTRRHLTGIAPGWVHSMHHYNHQIQVFSAYLVLLQVSTRQSDHDLQFAHVETTDTPHTMNWTQMNTCSISHCFPVPLHGNLCQKMALSTPKSLRRIFH